jgi:RNA polymerase sigma-70 factor (sigma-E family)
VDFEAYVDEQGPALLRLAQVLARDPHRAEDLTQTALATAYRHWSKVVAARDPHAYVRRMLVNAHLSWHRRRSSSERPIDLARHEPRPAQDFADDVAARDQLRKALATLAPRARTALVLKYYADLDDAAIAESMGVSASTVRSTLSRSLKALRVGGVLDTQEEAR